MSDMEDTLCPDCAHFIEDTSSDKRAGECKVDNDYLITLTTRTAYTPMPCDVFEKIYNSVRFIKEKD